MSLVFCGASLLGQGVLTDVGLIHRERSYHVIIQSNAHKLFRDLAGSKTVKFLGHVEGRTFADIENLAEELHELRMDDGSINWQKTRCDLRRESLASAGQAVTEG